MSRADTLRRDSRSVLVAIAWRRYLDAVRRCDGCAYEVIEELAWSHLVDQLARTRSTHRHSRHRAHAESLRASRA
jgi:hypothetical protein